MRDKIARKKRRASSSDAVPLDYGRHRPYDMVEAGERKTARRKWITSHSSLIASAFVAVAAVVQIFSVARNQPDLALAIIGYSAPSSVLLGAFTSALPILVGALGAYAPVMLLDTSNAQSRRSLAWVTVLCSLYTVTAGSTLYTILQLIAVLAYLLTCIHRKYWSRGPRFEMPGVYAASDEVWLAAHHRPDVELHKILDELRMIVGPKSIARNWIDRRRLLHKKYRDRYEAIDRAYELDNRSIYTELVRRALLPMLPLLITTGTFWVPSEVIVRGDVQEIVGYVLRQDPRWTTVVIDDPRSINQVPTTEITERNFCRPARHWILTPLATIVNPARGESVAVCP